MQTNSNPRRRFFIQLALVLLLICSGMVMILHIFTQCGQILLANQDVQLYYLAKSVDRNIDSLLGRCEINLSYITERRDFLEAQRVWLDTGETGDLLLVLKENLVTQDKLISIMLAMQGDEVFLSTNGELYYAFLPDAGADNLRPCIGADGTIYLAFICETMENLRYAALINLEAFYDQVVGHELAQYDWVLLTDISRELLLHPQQGQVQVERVDAVTSATCGQEGVDILLSQQKRQTIATFSYEYLDNMTDKTYTARMVVIPTGETENRVFAVGVVTNFENVIGPLNKAAFWLLCYGGMVAAGVLLLLRIVIRYRHRSEHDLQELQVLREKNEAMEALTKQTQQLAHHQRLETIGTLTASIAHEFNNLLTPIMGYSILTLEQLSAENEELYDNVLEIYSASRKARDIISRLSELSRKNSSVSLQPVSLDELISKALRVAAPARPAGVVVEERLSKDGCRVCGNETQLSQLLLNLILNAFQAMETEGGTLTISTFTKGSMAFLHVQDTGPGIPVDILPNIFEPFFTTKETGKGTGLGLAIVQQVVSEHHGEITVDTQRGQGCTFTVRLPLASREADVNDHGMGKLEQT